MSENVRIAYGDSAQDTAVQLLAAAEELGYEAWIVRHSDGDFYAPVDVAKKAGLDYDDPNAEAEAEPEQSPHDPALIGESVDADAAETPEGKENAEASYDGAEDQTGAQAQEPKAEEPKATAKKTAAKKTTAKKTSAKKSGS